MKKLRKRQKEVEQQEKEKSQRDIQTDKSGTDIHSHNKDSRRGEPHLVKQTFELDSFYDTDFEKVLIWVSNTNKVIYKVL